LHSVLVVDNNSNHNGKRVDIMIEGGIITEIKSSIHAKEKVKVIEGNNLHVSAGWFDMQVDFCDPGYEHKENLESGIRAAANGGYTGVCLMPSTNPPLHSKTQIEYIIQKTKGEIVDIYPFGTLTYGREGKDISEMYDMKLAGAIGFTDDKQAIRDAGLVLRALQYSDNIGSLVMMHCNDRSISNGANVRKKPLNSGIFGW
jgi:dihydroorotase